MNHPAFHTVVVLLVLMPDLLVLEVLEVFLHMIRRATTRQVVVLMLVLSLMVLVVPVLVAYKHKHGKHQVVLVLMLQQ